MKANGWVVTCVNYDSERKSTPGGMMPGRSVTDPQTLNGGT
jgi:hypothetical protein